MREVDGAGSRVGVHFTSRPASVSRSSCWPSLRGRDASRLRELLRGDVRRGDEVPRLGQPVRPVIGMRRGR